MRQLWFGVARMLSMLTVPYFRLELPGWRRLSGLVGLPIRYNAMWAHAKPKTIRLKPHGYRVTLDMRDWSERLAFFLGRHYDTAMAELIELVTRRGDTFVDVGANAGMILLAAAHSVGPSGRMYAFEPNPEMAERLRRLILDNGLVNTSVHECALSDENAERSMTVYAGSSGWSTLGVASSQHGQAVFGTARVKVCRADDVLLNKVSEPLVVKIDVEGYETHVIRGMRELIGRLRPLIITEIEPALLRAAHSSAEQLFSLLTESGYLCFQTMRSTGHGIPAQLAPVQVTSDIREKDVVWCHPLSALKVRIEEAVEPNPAKGHGNP